VCRRRDPAGYANQDAVIHEIGVGYDESPVSKRALDVARELASALDARLSAFEAISLPRYLFDGESAPAEESIGDFVNDARERIAALGGVELHAAYGHPAEELAICSASVDLLVVG
jgi:nucleotide-binding universal stress UspA family protein